MGDTFWLGRAEIGRSAMTFRPVLYYDIGWAGARSDFSRMGGRFRAREQGCRSWMAWLDGLVRIDVSRGIHPEQRWRGDVYIGSRF